MSISNEQVWIIDGGWMDLFQIFFPVLLMHRCIRTETQSTQSPCSTNISYKTEALATNVTQVTLCDFTD